MAELIYRSDLGRELTIAEVDGNFRELEDRIAGVGGGNVITDVEQDGLNVTLVFAEGLRRTFALPDPDGGLGEAPAEGGPFGRLAGAWTEVVEEAPDDGQVHGRQGGAWTPIGSSGGGGSDPDALVFRGAWQSGTAIARNSVYRHLGIWWVAIVNLTSAQVVEPSLANRDTWKLLSPFVDGSEPSTPVTDDLYHRRTIGSPATDITLGEYLRDLEYRLSQIGG